MKNSILFLWTFVCFVSNIHAQITITSTSTPSTCSANGSITIQASGGAMPYNYILDGVPQATLSSASYTITGVASGVHQLQVTDVNAMQSSIIIDSVGGNYIEPSLNCIYTNCEVLATVLNGHPPYQYQISYTTATGPFTPYQTSPVFGNLPIVNYCYVRVKDSCDNIYTEVVTVNSTSPYAFFNCVVVDSVTYDLTLQSTMGGTPPFTFTCITDSNGTTTNTTGSFSGLNGCLYKIIIEDNCGHIDSFSNQSCLIPSLSLDCINCNLGEVNVSATGGVAPYIFTINGAMNPPMPNTTGYFTGLSAPDNGQYYDILLQDACGSYVLSKHFYCLEASILCGGNGFFDGQVDFMIDANYLANNPHFPITVICNSCANHDTVIVDSTTVMPLHFDGLISGSQSYTMIDDCDNEFTIYSDCDIDYTSGMQYFPPGGGGGTPVPGPPGSGQTPMGCGNTLVLTCQTPNVSYEVYYLTTGALYASNTTGIFYFIPIDTFICNTISPTGFLLKSDTIDTSLFFTYLNKDCRTIMVGACPDSLVFTLEDAVGVSLVTGNTNGIFPNLTPGAWYQIFAKDVITNRTITQWVQIDSIGDLEYDIYACRDLIAVLTLPQNAQGVLTPTFSLTGTNTAYSQQNTTGIFPNLPYDTYNLMVTRGTCDTLHRQFVIGVPFNPNFCLIPPNTNTNNGTYWSIHTMPPPQTNYGLLDANGNLVLASPQDTTTYNNLSFGNYTFISPNCEVYDFTLPNLPDTILNVDVTSICSNLACIQASGGMDFSDWMDFQTNSGFNYCNTIHDIYSLIYNGNAIESNSTGVFCNLLVGGNYLVVLNRFNTPVDTVSITIPPYQQLNLSGTNGVVCNGTTTGDITLNLIGSGLPFTYYILNPPAGYSPTQITTNNTSAVFANLPAGNYQFMVYDACGVSSDYSASVSSMYFTPTWQRFCDETIQLFAPNYANASYTWTNSSGTIVGTTYNPRFVDVGAETYTVVVVTPNCSYTTNITIPAVSIITTNIFVNAGSDITLPYPYLSPSETAQLQGNVPITGESVHWTQIAPITAAASISSPNTPTTTITVNSPGIYTFEYQIVSQTCTKTDTIQVNFFDCKAFSIELDSIPENCANTSRNGQAIIHVLGGTGPYHFIWDDGKTGEIHTALSTGSHQVTIVDESGCITQNNTFEINVPYISPNVNAYFDSSPSNIADITIEDATINCHNLSTNATSYSWTFGPNALSSLNNNPTFVCPDTGLWTITLYARNAYCHDQYSSVYHVVTDGDVYIANAFTPNGDLDNDAFGPIGWHVVEMKFTVYDRWGMMIYQTERMDAPWDGTKKGVPCPEGAYVFVVDALLVTGERFKKAGTVTLIR